jgi:hypothetical protein
LLCASKNESVVRYALSGSIAPMAVAGYDLLPADVRAALPAAAELEEAIAHPIVNGDQLTVSEYLERLDVEKGSSPTT